MSSARPPCPSPKGNVTAGPDWSGVFQNERAVLAHERLGDCGCHQWSPAPVGFTETGTALAVNGEIYNHKSTPSANDFISPTKPAATARSFLVCTGSMAVDLVHRLDGMFAFVLYDVENDARG